MADFNVTFHTRKEATKTPLSEKEMSLLPMASLVQKSCLILCILFPLAFGGFALYATSHPAWSVQPAVLDTYKEKLDYHQQVRQAYIKTVERLNGRIRPDLVSAPLLKAPPKGVRMETIDYRTEYDGSRARGILFLKGFSTHPDLAVVEGYIKSLEKSLQRKLASFDVSLALEENSIDAKSGNLQFSIGGVIQ